MRKAIISGILILLFLLFALPFGLRFTVGRILRSTVGPTAAASTIKISPHAVLLSGVRAGLQRCDTIEITFDPLQMVSKPRRIRSVRIAGLSIEVAKDGDRWFLPGLHPDHKSKGDGPGVVIARLNAPDVKVRIQPLNLQGNANLQWAEKDSANYAARFSSTWPNPKDTFSISGDLQLGKDFRSIQVDSLIGRDATQKAVIQASITGSASDFAELSGQLDLARLQRLLPGKRPSSFRGTMRVWARMDDPLQTRRGRLRLASEEVGIGSWAAKLRAAARYEGGRFHIDSISVNHARFGMRVRGEIDPQSRRLRVNGDFSSKGIVSPSKQRLVLATKFKYDGPLNGDLRNATAQAHLTGRHDQDSGVDVFRISLDYTRGELCVVSNAGGGTGAGGGPCGKVLALSGDLPIENIGPLLQIAGLRGDGPGQIRWQVSGKFEEPVIEIEAKVGRAKIETAHLDSAGVLVKYADKKWTVANLYAAGGAVSLAGRGTWQKSQGRLDLTFTADGDSVGFCHVSLGDTLAAEAALNALPLHSLDLLLGDSTKIMGRLSAHAQISRTAGTSNWHGWIDWTDAQYQAVGFDRLSAHFGGTGRTLNLDSLRIQYEGRTSVIRGRAALPFTVRSPCSLAVALDRFPLEILPLFLRGTDSFQGQCTGNFALSGSVRDPEFNGFLRIDTLYARPWAKAPEFALSKAILQADRRRWSLSAQGRIDKLAVSTNAEGSYLGADSLKGRADITVQNSHGEANVQRVPGQGFMIKGKMKQVPVSMLHEILTFLEPVNGLADVEMVWQDGRLTGRLNAAKPQLFMIGADSLQAAFAYKDRQLRFDSVQIHSQTGVVQGAADIVVYPAMAFDVNATAQGFPIEISLGRSLFWGDVHFFGNSDSIQAICSPLRVRNLEYYIPQCDQVLRVAQGEARVTGNRLSFRDFDGTVEDRPAKVSGDIDFNLDRWNVHFWGEGDSLRISRGAAYWALVEHGDFDVTVSAERSRIKLGLHLAQGEFTQTIPKVALLQPGRGLYDPRRFEESQHMRLQIHVTSPESLWVNNNLAHARFGVDLTIGGTASLPIWQGRIEFLEGDIFYLAKDLKTPFTLSSGTVLFQNHQGGFNPQVDLEAFQVADVFWEPEQTDPDTVAVYLRIHGPLKKINSVELDCPEMVSRWPDLARQSKMQREMTILSVLLTGRPWEQLAQGTLGQVATNQAQSMFTAYLQATAQRRLAQLLHLDAIRFSGGDWSKLQEGKGPDLVITDQLNPKVNVEWASRVGSDILQSQQVRLQYKLRENLIVESAADQKTNYGMDLKYVVRF